MLSKMTSLLSKAYTIAETKMDSYLLKSRVEAYDDIERQSVDFDPDEYNNSQGWRDKIGPANFEVLKEISYSSSIFTAINLRRINEIAAFCHPQRSKFDIGYTIKKRNSKAQISEKEREEMLELLEFINNTGLEKNREKITKQPKSFEEFIRLVIDDRLRYNQIAFERVPLQYTKDGQFKLHSFYHVPGNSVRYASVKKDSKQLLKDSIDASINGSDTENYDKLKERIDELNENDLYYVQVKQGQPIRVFTGEELALIQGNLNSDLDNNGYCKGEFELILNMISAQIFGETHNRLYFTQGFSNKGILVIKNKMGRKDIQRFKQHFRQQMQGTSNSFRVPIVSNTDIQWVSFQSEAKDMEWKEWMYYLIKIICACFQMSPQEINFDISRESHGLGDSGGRQREIVNMFKETGVRPLLRWIQNFVNREIVKYYNPEYYKKYVFEFVGIDVEQQKDEIDRLLREVQSYKTINEVRRELGLNEVKNGDIILNGIYTGYLQSQQYSAGMDSGGLEVEDLDEDTEYEVNPDNKESDDISVKSNGADNTLHKSKKKIKVEWYK